jgi:hypothetical protein
MIAFMVEKSGSGNSLTCSYEGRRIARRPSAIQASGKPPFNETRPAVPDACDAVPGSEGIEAGEDAQRGPQRTIAIAANALLFSFPLAGESHQQTDAVWCFRKR